MHQAMEEEKKLTVKDYVELFWINLCVLIRNAWEFFKVALKYYGNFSFLKADIALRLMYLFHNPFSISKRFLMHRGEKEIYTYGETPLTTLEKIAKEAEISSNDCVFELGAGRGRGCFWLHSIVGCRVVGIEYIPEFVERANRIKNRLGIPGIEFRLADFLKTDFKGATVFYLYGTCLDDKSIKELASKFARMPAGTKIITVSYPLADYAKEPVFEISKHFMVSYTWGEADVYVQIVKK